MEIYKKIEALGSEIEIYLQSDTRNSFDEDLMAFEFLINTFEKRFSRFIDDSELSLLNRSDKPFKASSELINLLLLAKHFYQKTDGIFDPTILKALENQGYDKSFTAKDFNKREIKKGKLSEKIDFNQVIINAENKLVTLASDIKVDLGGIGKGYIVDTAVALFKSKGYKNFWISAGGDMYLVGLNLENKFFQVGVQNPLKLEDNIFNINVEKEMAIATSGIAKRQWLNSGHKYNHIIDPRTGLSVNNKILAVTVISNHAVKADIYAKTVLILGKEKGLAFINEQAETEAVITLENLEFSFSKNMSKYLIKI